MFQKDQKLFHCSFLISYIDRLLKHTEITEIVYQCSEWGADILKIS